MKFIFFIGESTTFLQIRETMKKLKVPKEAEILLLSTLVTLKIAERISTQFQSQDTNVEIYLLPGTAFEITQGLTETLDQSENIFIISGGSWLNALAIASVIKQAKLKVLRGKHLVTPKID